jgi:hypothetical protein
MRPNSRKLAKSLATRLGKLYIDYNRDPSASVILAGKGRSGTTWMGNIINYKRDYRYVFEPFFPREVEICRHFGPKRYIRPDSPAPLYKDPIEKVLSGRVRNDWTDSGNYKNSRRLFSKRLIKSIRATLFLKWIKNHYPKVPIILALRHPCAVVNSIKRQGWGTVLQVMISQEELVEDFLTPFLSQINDAQNEFERHIFSWCIENYVILKQFREGEIHLLFYEHLWQNPEQETEELFNFLGKKRSGRALRAVRKPSKTTGAKSREAIVSGKDVLGKWRKHFTADQIERAVEILSVFGLDQIYTDDLIPSKSGALSILRENAR